jgi:hypothetical protein
MASQNHHSMGLPKNSTIQHFTVTDVGLMVATITSVFIYIAFYQVTYVMRLLVLVAIGKVLNHIILYFKGNLRESNRKNVSVR